MNIFNYVKRIKLIGALIFLSVPAHAATISIDATIRDFLFSHPDFQNGGVNGAGLTTGLVETVLGADGKPVYIGGNTLSTAGNFDQWYRDVAGINQAVSYTFVLDLLPNGFYSYSNTTYFPIDGQGIVDQGTDSSGNLRNYSFTTEINTEFTYTGFTNQVEDFIFTGDDDVWVFINGMLVVDLGGTHGPVGGGVDIDSLGLTLGETYTLDIFHAERQTSGSNFSFSTAANLRSVEVPAPNGILILGLSLMFCYSKRKK